MSEPRRDSLDASIDRVATRLVSVQQDADAVSRIVASLPERREHAWRTWSSWPAQAAVAASILLAIVFARMTNDDRVTSGENGQLVALLDTRPMPGFVELRAIPRRVAAGGFVGSLVAVQPVRPPAVARTSTTEPFGLALIPVPDSLSLSTLQTTAPLVAVEPATVAPIALSELQLVDITPASKE